ncbi:Solute carrier family 25 member 48 [Gossypium arboreum]|uniref:Solute carrier family 25 member 48 n=1 Tax=Gossypium arboreum TaxID=29729 RepID=A0A0B0P1G9_GOSAR|nr:Solute carrier family 25 member 48 [Gossypium arboreum]
MDLSATQPQPPINQGDSTFSKKNKKISDAGDHISSTSFIDVATLLAENIRTVGLKINRSIASEVLIQQNLEMVIQESALKLYPTLCKAEGLIEDERYCALSKILDYPTQMLFFLVYLFLCDWND